LLRVKIMGRFLRWRSLTVRRSGGWLGNYTDPADPPFYRLDRLQDRARKAVKWMDLIDSMDDDR
jgi:hypothetical protein